MAPGKQPGERVFRGVDYDHVHEPTRRGEPLKAYTILDARERDLPPLPDEAGRKYETTQLDSPRHPAEGATYANSNSFALPFKISSPRPLAPLAKPSTHELVFPTHKSDTPLLRPKLRLQTGWDSLQRPVRLHSADDVSTASWRSASPQSFRSATSQDALFFPSSSPANPSHLHHASGSSIQHAKSKLSRPPTTQERATPCRFLGAVRLPKMAAVVRAAHTKATTSRAIDDRANDILAKPFIRSDAGPLHGVTVTVHRQRLVSEPMPMLAPSASSLLSLSPAAITPALSARAMKEKPLPTRTQDLITRDLPAIPVANDDHPEAADPIRSASVPASPSPSPPPSPTPAPPPTIVHMGRPPSGAKRRKHYKVHRVPVPRA
ncbi:hypothetical protein B0H17DRAFT_636949 [Mycena rosella]|uniref:Uncharacterized protein n=1 Tax=Mycena rosella TaxID=1033263 RepID=A0AAD7DEM7_MYCRO|nr:hypothetical protein B0H17DRAFT_636949 [Mycena rosella]